VSSYLVEHHDICRFGTDHLGDVSAYNDFNMLFLDAATLYYYNSLDRVIEELDAGVCGLSNHRLDTPWPKVEKGKKLLTDLLSRPGDLVDESFRILGDRHLAADEELPETGVGIEKERLLSAMHIEYPGYGTRSSNVVLFSKEGRVSFYEKDHLTGEFQEFHFS
jgi:uncharacterized protein with NRDE domain